MIDAQRHARVMDFGMAAPVQAAQGTRQPVGTPAYLAPEAAAGEAPTPAMDVYSAALVLVEMLTGHPPFSGRDRLEVLRRVLSEVPVSPADLVAGLPPAIAAVCLRCLEKDPRARFPSAASLAAAIES